MTEPIINPSTLTDGQKEAIRKEFINISELPKTISPSLVKMITIMNFTMVKIFGSDFFTQQGE